MPIDEWWQQLDDWAILERSWEFYQPREMNMSRRSYQMGLENRIIAL